MKEANGFRGRDYKRGMKIIIVFKNFH